MKSYRVTIQMKTCERYFPVVLFISSNFWVCGWNPLVYPFKLNLFSSSFTRSCLFLAFSKKLKFFWLSFFFRPLQRMCAGMLLAAFSFMMAAFVQIAIQVSNEGIWIFSILSSKGLSSHQSINQCDLYCTVFSGVYLWSCVLLQNSRVAVNEAPSSFANLRIINAGVCPINAFGLGLNAEIPPMQVGFFWCICHFRN